MPAAMRDILMLEVSDGFVVQGLVTAGASAGAWSDTIGTVSKETLQFLDDDIAKFMEEAVARRGRGAPEGPGAGVHERALRVVGRWMDEQKPRDVFLFEQDGAYVVRLHVAGQAGSHHMLAEFTQGRHQRPRQPGTDAPGGRPGESQRPGCRGCRCAGRPVAARRAAAARARPAPRTPNGGNTGWGDPTG